MNQRIRELKHLASVWCDENIPEQYSEETNGYGKAWEDKFAELIVRECVNRVRSRQMFAVEDDHTAHHAFDLLVYDIESHFGVEE